MLHVTNLHRADRILERGLGQPNATADLHANLNQIFIPWLSMCEEMIISPWHKSSKRQAVTLTGNVKQSWTQTADAPLLTSDKDD
jgi:hypothetical protein